MGDSRCNVNMRYFTVFLLFIFFVYMRTSIAIKDLKPNYIIFLADDFGYGDLSSYGHPTQEFGPIDELALEGVRFTNWYSAHTYCTPSRAALLTGRLPIRYGLIGGLDVLLPHHTTGLPHTEYTLAEALKDVGYRTGIVGKWHLGINRFTPSDGHFLPHNHGFTDVGTIIPTSLLWDCDTTKVHRDQQNRHRCFLYRNTTIFQQPINLNTLTRTLVQDAASFLHEHADRQFFLLFSIPQVHTPMYNDPQMKGTSRRGTYGDQVNEMGWAVGQVMKTVNQLNLDNKTLAIFLSDHGPNIEICREGGTAGVFKGGKGNFYEGGIRVPAIMRWQGTLPAGRVSHQLVSTMDLYTTLINMAGGKLPDSKLDGLDLAEFLSSLSQKHNQDVWKPKTEPNFHKNRMLFFYCRDYLMATRYKKFKIHFRTHPLPPQNYTDVLCVDGVPKDTNMAYMEPLCNNSKIQIPPLVYNVEEDPEERYPLNPDLEEYKGTLNMVLNEVEKFEKGIKETGEQLTSLENLNRYVLPCCNPPYCLCDNARPPKCLKN